MDVRRGENELVPTTNLVVHDAIANVFDEASQFLPILDVVKEILDVPLFRERGEILESTFQCPIGPYASASAL